MSAQPKKTTRAVLTGILFEDPWRKLASVALAVLLWQYLDGQVSDSLDLEVVMIPVTKSDSLTGIEPKSLALRLAKDRYSVMGFENARTGEPLSQIELNLHGRRHLISEVPKSGVFQTSLDPIRRDQQDFAEFEISDIAPANSSFQGLLQDMRPDRVRVLLSRNRERDIQVSRDRILVVAPDDDSTFASRLMWDDVRFEPSLVKVHGPEALVEPLDNQKLWIFRPEPMATGAKAISQTLKLNLDDERLSVSSPVKITIKLAPDFPEYRLTNLPVVLSEPPELRGRFELESNTVDIVIQAKPKLDSRLYDQTPEARQRWLTKQRAVVIAKLPDSPQGSGPIDSLTLSLDGYLEKIDFEVRTTPKISYRSKDQ